MQTMKLKTLGENCAISTCNKDATHVVILKMEDDGKKIGVKVCEGCLQKGLKNAFGGI